MFCEVVRRVKMASFFACRRRRAAGETSVFDVQGTGPGGKDKRSPQLRTDKTRSSVLTHRDWDKMDARSQTTFSSTFSWMEMFELQLNFTEIYSRGTN